MAIGLITRAVTKTTTSTAIAEAAATTAFTILIRIAALAVSIGLVASFAASSEAQTGCSCEAEAVAVSTEAEAFVPIYAASLAAGATFGSTAEKSAVVSRSGFGDNTARMASASLGKGVLTRGGSAAAVPNHGYYSALMVCPISCKNSEAPATQAGVPIKTFVKRSDEGVEASYSNVDLKGCVENAVGPAYAAVTIIVGEAGLALCVGGICPTEGDVTSCAVKTASALEARTKAGTQTTRADGRTGVGITMGVRMTAITTSTCAIAIRSSEALTLPSRGAGFRCTEKRGRAFSAAISCADSETVGIGSKRGATVFLVVLTGAAKPVSRIAFTRLSVSHAA